LSYSPEKAQILPISKQKMEPFSFIISLALASFLKPGHKPTLENYHITWDPPNEIQVTSNTKVAKQSYDRTCKGELASRKVTTIWEKYLKLAFLLHSPHQEAEKTKSFSLAIKGLENIKDTYSQESQDDEELLKRLDRCIELIENGLRAENGLYLGSIASISNSTSTGNQEEGSSREAAKNAASNDYASKLKMLWDRTSIDQINMLFEELEELSTMRKSEQQQKLFDDTIQTIATLINQKCSKYGILLEEKEEQLC